MSNIVAASAKNGISGAKLHSRSLQCNELESQSLLCQTWQAWKHCFCSAPAILVSIAFKSSIRSPCSAKLMEPESSAIMTARSIQCQVLISIQSSSSWSIKANLTSPKHLLQAFVCSTIDLFTRGLAEKSNSTFCVGSIVSFNLAFSGESTNSLMS